MSNVILNVDGHEPTRYARGEALRRAGFEVLDAGSASEALDFARRYLPALILLDVNLPDMGGIEVSRRLKSDPATKAIPVVQISAVSREEADFIAGLEGGADTYITEPVLPEVLVATVSALLRFARERPAGASEAVDRHKQFGWLRPETDEYDTREQRYGDLVRFNTSRLLLDAAGEKALREIAQDYVDVLKTSCAIYERSGDYAIGIYDAGWCRILNAASRRLCGTADDREALASGKWICHESCFEASRRAMDQRRPVDLECAGGHRLYGVPITADEEVVGSIVIGYGDPPSDPQKLAEISARFDIPIEELRRKAARYHSRPPALIEAARRQLAVSARLIGELVKRKRAEDAAGRARGEAERAMDRVVRVQDITAALVEAVTTEDVLDTIIGRVMARTGAETGVVVLLSDGGKELTSVRIRGYPPDAAEKVRRLRADAKLPIADAVRTGGVITIRDSSDPRYPELAGIWPAIDAGAGAALPFCISGRVLGALGLRFPEPRDFTREDTEFFTTVGRACAAALERAQLYDSERRAREDLERSEKRYRLLVEANPIGVGLAAIAGPEYGRLFAANEALLEMLGYNREDLKAGCPRWPDITPEEFREADARAIAEARRDGRSRPYEKELVRKDGSRVAAMIAVALISETEAVAFVVDITERKRQEQALRESEARLRFVAESSPDHMFIQDCDLRYLWISRPAPPLSRGDYVGNTDSHLTTPENAEILTGIKRRVLEDGKAITVEIPLVINGEQRYFDTTYEPWRDASGKIIGLAGYRRDITERKRMDKRLQEAQRLESVGVLAAGIAHDFNNILTGILGGASLLVDEVPPQYTENVRRILSSAERAALLTRQLLAYAGKGRFVLAELDMSHVVSDMSGLLRMSVPKSVDLDLHLAENLPRVAGDPNQMQQLIMNLVTNGAEAIPEGRGGRVTVRTGLQKLHAAVADATGQPVRPGEYVTISVADTGAGISEQIKTRMFDPFYTTKFTGRGLGLPAVAGIVRAQKGGVFVESAPGRGTTFRVLLPAGAVRQETRVRPAILVVDDEESVREFIAAALERRGYEVITATNGREGLEAWEQAHDRVVLMIVDVLMPVMSGGQLLAELPRGEGGCKVLITSGYSEADAMRLCGWCEADGFLQKPYTAQQLGDKVADVLGGAAERAA